MVKRLLTLALACIFLMSSACATIMAERPTPIKMQANEEAEVWVDGNRVGSTPCTVPLSPSSPKTITFKRQGCKDVTVSLTTGVGGKWVIADILFGLVPLLIDAVTGDWNQFDDDTIVVTMEPK